MLGYHLSNPVDDLDQFSSAPLYFGCLLCTKGKPVTGSLKLHRMSAKQEHKKWLKLVDLMDIVGTRYIEKPVHFKSSQIAVPIWSKVGSWEYQLISLDMYDITSGTTKQFMSLKKQNILNRHVQL